MKTPNFVTLPADLGVINDHSIKDEISVSLVPNMIPYRLHKTHEATR